jgi:hypothetical protein
VCQEQDVEFSEAREYPAGGRVTRSAEDGKEWGESVILIFTFAKRHPSSDSTMVQRRICGSLDETKTLSESGFPFKKDSK